jgi:hypothetical protein
MNAIARLILSAVHPQRRKSGAGYGNVNSWPRDPAALSRACALAGVPVAHVAVLGWALDGEPRGFASVEEAIKRVKAYGEFIKACRAWGVKAFVECINGNCTQSKHGNIAVSKIIAVQCMHIAAVGVRDAGPQGVLGVQVVGEADEWWAEHDRSWASVLSAAGFQTVCNHGSRPTTLPQGYARLAYHPNKLSDHGPANCLLVNDTSGAIAAVSGGDVYARRCDPQAVGDWVRGVPADRTPVLYGFMHREPDKESLRAIRKAIK